MFIDVLYDAAIETREYLENPATAGAYQGEMRTRLVALVEEMESIIRILDIPPLPTNDHMTMHDHRENKGNAT